ncbi:LAFE_0H13014g1_1 [Lachancea fermentati]|uniref:LAFE_0H13014g1_1 n=1 Tax=Lachancea fermentati TaxID=4955 RepID=A0A1G4MKJ4_LACFM|nr:LAFE_0H13014g1_1 [Lachancea fermentati]
MNDSLSPVNSPVFPVDKDLDIPSNAQPLSQTTSIQIYIQLAEPVVFLQGFEQHQWSERPPGLLRGSLIIRVLKPSKIKSISLNFKGVSKTEWPEGIPPKKQEFVESIDIVNHTWPFFQVEHNHVQNSNSCDADDLLKGSSASLYRPLKKKDGSVSTMSLNPTISPNQNKHQTSGSLLPISNILRRATSPDHHAAQQRSRSSTNAISDLLTSTLSNGSDSNSVFSKSSTGNEPFIFQPGEYVYSFEQPIPLSCPESIQASFGSVEYYLQVSVDRAGAFKSNIHTRFPLKIVRTQSDSSVEETEPIAISRDWEDQLHYDIVIASKDIVLDAFLPIAFRVTPMDKVTLHRIRIYLTETLEYYCKNKKVHRLEPTKKFLLAEHKAAPLDDLPSGANLSKAKNLGNLLVDERNGDIISKEFEYQVFIPERLNVQQRIHPDTSYQNIKSNHWIKICLRLSRLVDGKRKHYEISIDSPIHVLHKLCSHANTLLPSYDTHSAIPGGDASQFGDLGVNLYHSSNLYFPKEILNSPVMSPEVHPLEERLSFSPRSLTPIQNARRLSHSHNQKSDDQHKKLDDFLLNSPEMKSNIYQPDHIQPELVSPQAIPLSPISSPLARPIHLLRKPSFEPPPFDADLSPPPAVDFTLENGEHRNAPKEPPSYEDVMTADGISPTFVPPQLTITAAETGRSAEDLSAQRSLKTARDNSGDIASSFSFQGSIPGSPDLPMSVLRPNSPQLKPLGATFNMSRRGSIQDNLPSTIKNSSDTFNDLNDVLGCSEGEGVEEYVPKSQNSSAAASPRSSMDTTTGYYTRGTTNMEPLLSSKTNQTMDTFLQSRESITGYEEPSTEASVDITALYDRNSNAWHPLQNEAPMSPVLGKDYSFNVAEGNNVFEDFQKAFRVPAGTETPERNEEASADLVSSGATLSSEQSLDDNSEIKRQNSSLQQKQLVTAQDKVKGSPVSGEIAK